MTLQPSYSIPKLPPLGVDFQTPELLKALVAAHRHLAELKGCAASIPNQAILINTLALQEAKASSEVESYVTTQDELFQAGGSCRVYSLKGAGERSSFVDTPGPISAGLPLKLRARKLISSCSGLP